MAHGILPAGGGADRQPQWAASIDWSNPLARDVVAIIDGAGNVLAPSMLSLSNSGNFSRKSTAKGLALSSGANGVKVVNSGSGYLVAPSVQFTVTGCVALNSIGQTNKYFAISNGAGITQTAIIYGYSSGNLEFYSDGYTGANPRTGSQIGITDTLPHTFSYAYGGGVFDSSIDGRSVNSVAKAFTLPSTDVAGALFGSSATTDRIDASLLLWVVHRRKLSPVEQRSLTANPWQLFRDDTSDLLIFDMGAGGGGSLTLTGADSASTTTASTGVITQAHNLAGADSVQANTAGTGSIGSTIILAGTAGSSATTGTTGAVGQIHVLGGANSSSAGVASTGAITQVHVLAGANATQTNTGSTAALGETAINLAGSAGSSATVASTGAITQVHALVGAASVQDNVASASAIVQAHMLAGAAGVSASVGSVGAVVVFDYAVTPSPYIAYVPAVPHLALVPAVQSTAIRGL